MTIQPNDVLRVDVIHDNDISGDVVNSYQYQYAGLAPALEADVLDDIASIMETLYLIVQGIINVRNVLREVKVSNITQGVLIGSTDAKTYTGGTSLDPAQPQGASPYAYFKTNIPRVITRKFLPPASDNDMGAGGGLNTAAQTALAAYATEVLVSTLFGPRAYDYGYLSPKTLAFEQPVLAVISVFPGYQRRRKPAVGS